MGSLTINMVNDKIESYAKSHAGDKPLYIIVSPSDGDRLLEEIRSSGNFEREEFITTYRGSKIVKHDVVHPGEILVSNELPETSS